MFIINYYYSRSSRFNFHLDHIFRAWIKYHFIIVYLITYIILFQIWGITATYHRNFYLCSQINQYQFCCKLTWGLTFKKTLLMLSYFSKKIWQTLSSPSQKYLHKRMICKKLIYHKRFHNTNNTVCCAMNRK